MANRIKKNPRNQESSLYKSLTRLLSGPVVNYRRQTPRRERRRNLDKYKFKSATGQQFKKSSLINKIDQNDQYLSNLKVYKSYEDPRSLYDIYLNKYIKSIISDPNFNQEHMMDFGYLEEFLLNKIRSEGQINCFTFTAFMKSSKINTNSSGLSIEISNLDYNNDKGKISEFINTMEIGS